MRKGKITPNGVILEKHEYKTITVLAEQGFDIELIPPSNRKGIRSPDVTINGLDWEIKSPKGKGRWLLENTLQRAVQQSPYVIVDLSRIKIHQNKCLRELEKQFNYSKGLDRLRVITKTKKIIDFHK